MPTPTDSATILQTDSQGRVKTPPDEREALLDAFEQSGLSGAAFARLHGIRYQTFASWRRKRRRERKAIDTCGGEDVAVFTEVRVAPDHQAGIGIELPGGARMHLDRADQFPMAAALLKYLERA